MIVKFGSGSGAWPPTTITAGDTVAMAANISKFYKYPVGSSEYQTISGSAITIKKRGTYRFKTYVDIAVIEGSLEWVYGLYVQLFKNDDPVPESQQNLTTTTPTYSYDLLCEADDVIKIGYKHDSSGGATTGFAIGSLLACVSGDNGFLPEE